MYGPQSRYRIYGGFVNYVNTLRDGLVRRPNPKAVSVLEAHVQGDFKVANAVAVPMARVGIYLAVKNLIRPGQEVALSPYTIADVINMVIAAGGRPRFVDVDPQSGNMDPIELKKNLGKNSGAILITHLHGITAAIEDTLSIAKIAGLPVIEDCAQALGAETASGMTATLGEAGVLSFGTYKNINSWFGGMVLTGNHQLASKIRAELETWQEFSASRLRLKVRQAALIDILGWQPIFGPILSRIFRYGVIHEIEAINRMTAIELDTSRYDQLPGWYQTRFTAVQAGRVLEQWPNLKAQSELRIHKAQLYNEGLAEHASLTKPPAPVGRRHVYTYYPLQSDQRQNLLKWLMYSRRDVAAQHLKNCAHLESFKEFRAHCPEAERVAKSVILLPTYPSYRDQEVAKNLALIRWYLDQGCPEFSPAAKGLRQPSEVFE